MQVTVETTPESDANFHVQIPWDAIDRTSEQVFRRLAQQHTVPGFRKGHVPRPMIERIVGRDAIYEEAIDIIAEDAIRASAKEHQLTLLAAPHAHVHDINYGQDHDITVTVPVLGHGELADYEDLRLNREPVEVTDEDIAAIISRARDQMAEWPPVERPAEIGDRVSVTMTFTVGEKNILENKDNEFELITDRTGLYAGIDEHIIGMADGESKEFDTTIPAEYGKAEMAGQTGHYAVTVNKITSKVLPEIDDEFAKQAGGFASVEAMRDSVRADLIRTRGASANRKLREALVDALIERLTLAIPPLLIEAEADDLMQELGDVMARDGVSMDQFLQILGKTRDEYRDEQRPEAERRIKQRRLLELVAEREHLGVSEAELQALLDAYAGMGRGARTRVRQLKPAQRLSVERSMLRDKALDWLVEHHTTGTEPDAAVDAGAQAARAAHDATVAAASAETEPEA